MSRIAVFAYGSLVSRPSAAQTLGRPVDAPLPAQLAGWRRSWTLARDNARAEKTFAQADGSLPQFCLGLNLEPADSGPAVNGALVEVSESELERLDLREIRYRRIEVDPAVDPPARFDAVFAYRARPEHHHPTAPEGAILIASYLRAVEAAFAELGSDQLELFRRSTDAPPVEVVEARLVGDRIPPGNPRDW